MIISSATPQDLIGWFHNDQDTALALCILIAPSTVDQGKLDQVITDVFHADALLGERIAFLLIHPAAEAHLALNFGSGEYAVIPGAIFPRALRDLALFCEVDLGREEQRSSFAGETSRHLARFAPEFIKLLNVRQTSLPALCVLVRNIGEPAVIRLDPEWTTDELLTIIRGIHEALQEEPDSRTDGFENRRFTSVDIGIIENCFREIDAKRAQFTEALEGLAGRHGANAADRRKLAEFMVRSNFDSSDVECLLDSLSISHSPRFRSDGRIEKVLRITERLTVLEGELSRDGGLGKRAIPLCEQAARIKHSRDNLRRKIQALGKVRFVAFHRVSSVSAGLVSDKWLDRFIKLWEPLRSILRIGTGTG